MKTYFFRVMLIALLGITGSAGIWAIPSTVAIQGVLTDASGKPLTGNRQWRIKYFDAKTGGNQFGNAIAGLVTVSPNGRWSISVRPPGAVLNAEGAVWYELTIDSAPVPDNSLDPNDVFPERVLVESVMFALSTSDSRPVLKSATTFYVAPNGNDATGDGSSAKPWATRIKALHTLQQIDLNGQLV